MIVACTTALAAHAWAAEPPASAPAAPPIAGADAGNATPDTAPPSTEAPFRYRIAIEAPGPIRDVVNASLGLVRWQTYADMTEDLFDRLAREAIDEAREAAATEGYFSAHVDISVDPSQTPAVVTIRITPGDASRIRAVDIDVTGPASSDAGAGARTIAEVREEWRLPLGAIFRQAAWTEAKDRAVAQLAANQYAAAKLAASQADIDPDAHAADLHVTIDSGPPFRVGALEVTGVKRYDADLVRHYSTLRRGEPYSLAELDQYVRRLNATGYFASVHAVIDTDPAHADDAPVTVSVIEAPPKRLEVGIGFSTDTRARFTLSYRDVDFATRALQFTTDVRLEQDLQNATVRIVRPPDASGWSQAYSTQLERTDISGLITQTASVGARRISLDERNQWQYGAAFLVDEQRPTGGERISSHALYADVQRIWRRVDDLVAPTRGYATLVEVGGGVPGVSTRTFGRVLARFAAWHPINRENELSARLEGGAVLAGSRNGIPSTLLFRTGGDTSVRGYAFESLGVRQGDATVGGRYYGLASLEVTHWFREALGGAVFVDAGNAWDHYSDFHLALGYGIGARVRTPIGPFRLDVAYGQDTRAVRVHFSVGLAF